jgi:Secretion system C-terminal sorting domain/FG-GAP-like repeat
MRIWLFSVLFGHKNQHLDSWGTTYLIKGNTMKNLPAVILLCLLPLVATAEFQWMEHTISTNATNTVGVEAIDLDQDGDMDVITYGYDDISWWENDGLLSFTEHVLFAEEWVTLNQVVPEDLDSDGDIDIIIGGYEWPENGWWENDGLQNFTYHVIQELSGTCHDLFVCDVDGDNDMDILRNFHDPILWESSISWWENDGAESFTRNNIVVTSELYSCDVEDLDNDGDMDLVLGIVGSDAYHVMMNDGFSNFALTLTTQSTNDVLVECILSDINSDGAFDILATYDVEPSWLHEVTWMTAELLPTEHSIASYNWLNRLWSEDLDADGDMDVLGTREDGWGPYCWENTDGDGLIWDETTLPNAFATVQGIDLYDVDNDGDLDVVGVATFDNTLVWWELLGTITPDPIVITLTPHNEPVSVPRGGSFMYDLGIEFHLNNATLGYIWSEAVLPNGATYGPIFSTSFLFTPTMTINVTEIQQDIPAMAPLGVYGFVVNAGPSLNVAVGSDSFPFTVTAAQSIDVSSANDWISTGHEQIASGTTGNLVIMPPDEYALVDVYPNPFNPTTTISVALPVAAELSVAVFNALGQQVAELANGSYAAGTHSLTLDGSELASGIYFVHASVPGELNAVQKVVLMK